MPHTARLARLIAKRSNHIALIAFGVVLLLIGIVSAVVTLREITAATDKVEHTLAIERELSELGMYNERLEAVRRGFLVQPDSEFLALIAATQRDFDKRLASLLLRTEDNAAQTDRLQEIAAQDARRRRVIESDTLSPATALAAAQEGQLSREPGTVATRRIRSLVRTMKDVEGALLIERNRAQLSSLLRFYLVGGITLLLGIAMLGLVIFLTLRSNRALARAEEGLRTANDTLEQTVEQRTVELVRANQEIQRFAYIVSHDLRSPLVNILGFTSELAAAHKALQSHVEQLSADHPDLVSTDARYAVEEDIPEALGFIRTSTEKMDRLINSILELSRQGRRELKPDTIDTTELASNIADTLVQRAEDAGATVTVEPLPPVQTDRLALEQILSNLMENALKYLSPKRAGAVTVRGRREGGRIVIEVADNGRGIAPADHERIFELFRRAGTQDQAGEGIGLANVRALAYRLGGTVSVESTLDEGSVFRLSLPITFVAVETFS